VQATRVKADYAGHSLALRKAIRSSVCRSRRGWNRIVPSQEARPMPFMLIRHKVKDYLQWKFVFVEHAMVRKSTGSQGGLLFQNAADPNELFILMEWDDLERARAFAASEDLRDAMERAGVAEKPDVYFLQRVETPSW
jgi:hypothetical protein